MVSEVAKWKCQSLYDIMEASPMYNPTVGIMRPDSESDSYSNTQAILRKMEEFRSFFEVRKCNTVNVFDAYKMTYINLREYSPDLVFYQQPWNISEVAIGEMQVSKFALPCYVPYYVANYFDREITYGLVFHKLLCYCFVLNEKERKLACSTERGTHFGGKFVVSGHPMLDDFYLRPIEEPKKSCVIYAPHFTFSHPNNPVLVHYSTFLNNGEWLLQYAKAHPEMNWVFKPHPVLRSALYRSGVWSNQKIDEYYSEWGKIGRVCEKGDYLQLFREATAMITDCGSFLSEFGATRKPIVHLINSENKLRMPELYDTYYKVHNLDELSETLYEVLQKGNDYKKEIRINAVEKANLAGQYAARNIMNFLDKEFRVKGDMCESQKNIPISADGLD